MEKRLCMHPHKTLCNQSAIATVTHAQTQHTLTAQPAQLLRTIGVAAVK